MRMWLVGLVGLGLAGCGGGAAECGPAECAAVCADEGAASKPAPASDAPKSTGGAKMTQFEDDLVRPLLEDLRGGVRPWDDEGIGICSKKGKECDSFIGAEATDLDPKKEYMLRAILRVPDVGEKGTWSVNIATECTTVVKDDNGESSSSRNYNKSYDVIYAGKERGYRLQPLVNISAPSKGTQTCQWVLTAPHPDGDKVYKGEWSVSAP